MLESQNQRSTVTVTAARNEQQRRLAELLERKARAGAQPRFPARGAARLPGHGHRMHRGR